MAAEQTHVGGQEQYPLDLPEEVLFTNMIAYHAYNFQRYAGMKACSAQIIYDSSEPVSTLSLYTGAAPGPKRNFWQRSPQPRSAPAYRGSAVLHPPARNDNYIITCLSFNDIDIVRPAGYEVTSDDVPTGMLVIRGDDMVKVGRPDLGKTERKRLHSTVYAPYIGRFVLRQDAFETNGVIFRRAAKTPLEELKSLHDHMGGGNCSCRVMVRLNHYGTMAMLPKWKWLCQVNAEGDEA